MAVENLTLAQFFATNRNPYNYAKIEQISRDVSTAWLTLEECTQQLNLVDDETQDGYISSIELATRFAIEDYLGMAIFATTYRVYYANIGMFDAQISLDLPEVSNGSEGVTINNVSCYTSSNTVPIVLSNTNYSYDPTGNRVILNSIPNTLNQDVANPIFVEYSANASQLSTYPSIKQAGLMILTHIYNNRSASTDVNLKAIPFGVDSLLRPYKPLVM